MIDTKQSYHLEPKVGLLNDPVGLTYFKNRYHVFFQWNSKAKDHSSKEWGHFSSRDLLHWTTHDSALKPDQEYDRNGVYSGSSVVFRDKLYAFYTGNRKDKGIRTVKQCLATSQDGFTFQKQGPVLEVPPGYTTHFRDPRVIVGQEGLEMYIGAQDEQHHAHILKFVSANGIQWHFDRVIGTSHQYHMIECPDKIETSSGTIWLYCLQKRNPQTDECLESIAVYRIESSETLEPIDLDKGWEYLDAGFDCFAAQTLCAPDGRILMYSWMNRLSDAQEQLLASRSDSIHCLTLPREITIQDRCLIQKPARELLSLFETSPITPTCGMTLKEREWFGKISCADNSFTMEWNNGEAGIAWNSDAQHFTLYRKDWSENVWEERSVMLEKLNEVEVFMDRSSVEVFLNDGEKVLSARLLPNTINSSFRWTGLNETAIRIYRKKREGRKND